MHQFTPCTHTTQLLLFIKFWSRKVYPWTSPVRFRTLQYSSARLERPRCETPCSSDQESNSYAHRLAVRSANHYATVRHTRLTIRLQINPRLFIIIIINAHSLTQEAREIELPASSSFNNRHDFELCHMHFCPKLRYRQQIVRLTAKAPLRGLRIYRII